MSSRSADTNDSHCMSSLQETNKNVESRVMKGEEKHHKQLVGRVRVIFTSIKKSR